MENECSIQPSEARLLQVALTKHSTTQQKQYVSAGVAAGSFTGSYGLVFEVYVITKCWLHLGVRGPDQPVHSTPEAYG